MTEAEDTSEPRLVRRDQELYWGIRLASGCILPPQTDTSRIDPRFYLPGSSLVPVPWPPRAIVLTWINRPAPPHEPPHEPKHHSEALPTPRSPTPPIKVPPRRKRTAGEADRRIEGAHAPQCYSPGRSRGSQGRELVKDIPMKKQCGDQRTGGQPTAPTGSSRSGPAPPTKETRIPIVYRWEPFRRHSTSNSERPSQISSNVSSPRWARNGHETIIAQTLGTSSAGGPSPSGSPSSLIAFAASTQVSSSGASGTRGRAASSQPSSPNSNRRRARFRGHSEDRCIWRPGTLHRLQYRHRSPSQGCDPDPRPVTVLTDPPPRRATQDPQPRDLTDRGLR